MLSCKWHHYQYGTWMCTANIAWVSCLLKGSGIVKHKGNFLSFVCHTTSPCCDCGAMEVCAGLQVLCSSSRHCTVTTCVVLGLGSIWAGLRVLCSSSREWCNCAIFFPFFFFFLLLDLESARARLYVLYSSSRYWYNLCHIRLRICMSRTICPSHFFQILVQPVPLLIDLGSVWAGLCVLCCCSRYWYNLCHY